VKEAGKRGELCLLILARDAGENARLRLDGLRQARHGVPAVDCGDREALGRAVGRAEVVVVGITDPGLGKRIETAAG
jgi:ribosomal protein L7Ae-like RNA K-turn-binding protein